MLEEMCKKTHLKYLQIKFQEIKWTKFVIQKLMTMRFQGYNYLLKTEHDNAEVICPQVGFFCHVFYDMQYVL